MKGFLRRDLSLLRLGLWLYPILIGAVLAVNWALSRRGISNYTVYFLMVFEAESLQSLMTYDGMNGWLAYAAAVPGGREKAVDARYLLALLLALILTGFLFLMALLQGEGLALWAAGLYGSAYLFTLSVILPMGCRWGYKGATGRLAVTIATFVLLGVLGGLFSGVLQSAREDLARGLLRADVNGFFTVLAWVIPLLGLGVLALSWRLSRHIMEKKEF